MPVSAEIAREKSEAQLKWHVEDQIAAAIETGAFRVDIALTSPQYYSIQSDLEGLGYRVSHNGFDMRVCW